MRRKTELIRPDQSLISHRQSQSQFSRRQSSMKGFLPMDRLPEVIIDHLQEV